jgi:hypothetical protein
MLTWVPGESGELIMKETEGYGLSATGILSLISRDGRKENQGRT